MRGRLINPFLAELYALDTAATAADPDVAGALTSGYDTEFREAVRVPDGTWQGASGRKEATAVRVRCQVEDQMFEKLDPLAGGFEHQHRLGLVFHFRDLEQASLVDTATGQAKIRVAARCTGIYDLSGNVQHIFPSPGLYAVEARPISYGLGRRLNLLLVSFEGRDMSVRS